MNSLTETEEKQIMNVMMQPVESANSCLSNLRTRIENMMEHLDCSEITITFKDSYLNQINDMDDVIKLLEKYFLFVPINGIKDYVLIPEYGDNSRIHFHGVIRATAKAKATLLLHLRKRFGFSSIKMIVSNEKYLNYIFKENPDFEDIIQYVDV